MRMSEISPKTAVLTRGREIDIVEAGERGKEKRVKGTTGPSPTFCTFSTGVNHLSNWASDLH